MMSVRCSKFANDAITGIKAAFFMRESCSRAEKERIVQFTKKKKRNVDGHASDPHISSRETAAASLV